MFQRVLGFGQFNFARFLHIAITIMEVRSSILYVFMFTGINAVMTAPHLYKTRSCDSFPPSMRFLCYQVESIWANDVPIADISNRGTNDVGAESNDVQLVLGDVGMKKLTKNPGCGTAKCQLCSVPAQCTKCEYGYFLQFDPEAEAMTCVRKCLPGYKPLINANGNATCERVNRFRGECRIRKCSQCLDTDTCSLCFHGYYPQFNSDSEKIICVKHCFNGYALNTDSNLRKSCKEIPSPVGCSDFRCTLCRRGFYMQPNNTDGKLCARKCPKGYLKDRIRRKCVHWPL